MSIKFSILSFFFLTNLYCQNLVVGDTIITIKLNKIQIDDERVSLIKNDNIKIVFDSVELINDIQVRQKKIKNDISCRNEEGMTIYKNYTKELIKIKNELPRIDYNSMDSKIKATIDNFFTDLIFEKKAEVYVNQKKEDVIIVVEVLEIHNEGSTLFHKYVVANTEIFSIPIEIIIE